MKNPNKNLASTALLFVLLSTILGAETLEVPAQFPTIQGAIDAAVDGDLVLVSPGTYAESLDFLGKAIEVRALEDASTTTIDAAGTGSVVMFASNESRSSLLRGFTLRGGTGTGDS